MRIAGSIVLVVLAGCGGSGGFSGATISLTSAGASPSTITIPSGGQVQFVNNDSAPHQIASTSCTELGSPSMSAKQTFTATLTGPKSCTFNDGLNPSMASFSGSITVSAPGAGGGGGGSGY